MQHGVGVVVIVNRNREPLRNIMSEEVIVEEHAREHSAHSQNGQRYDHNHRAFMRVIMCMLVTFFLTIERQEHQTPTVETRHRSGRYQHPERIVTYSSTSSKRALNNRVFRQEPSQTDIG